MNCLAISEEILTPKKMIGDSSLKRVDKRFLTKPSLEVFSTDISLELIDKSEVKRVQKLMGAG